MDFMNYIVEQSLILIPALYILGKVFKTSQLPDKYIPLVLLVIGVTLSMFLTGFNVQSFVQGILVTGAAVFTDQITKQLAK